MSKWLIAITFGAVGGFILYSYLDRGSIPTRLKPDIWINWKDDYRKSDFGFDDEDLFI